MLALAERDLKAVAGMVSDADTFSDEIFGFHAQQALEKAFKAWIALLGEKYQLTHNIGTLLQQLEDLGCDVAAYWDMMEYNPVGVAYRYDSLTMDDSPLDRPKTLEQVQSIYDHVIVLIAGLDNKTID